MPNNSCLSMIKPGLFIQGLFLGFGLIFSNQLLIILLLKGYGRKFANDF